MKPGLVLAGVFLLSLAAFLLVPSYGSLVHFPGLFPGQISFLVLLGSILGTTGLVILLMGTSARSVSKESSSNQGAMELKGIAPSTSEEKERVKKNEPKEKKPEPDPVDQYNAKMSMLASLNALRLKKEISEETYQRLEKELLDAIDDIRERIRAEISKVSAELDQLRQDRKNIQYKTEELQARAKIDPDRRKDLEKEKSQIQTELPKLDEKIKSHEKYLAKLQDSQETDQIYREIARVKAVIELEAEIAGAKGKAEERKKALKKILEETKKKPDPVPQYLEFMRKRGGLFRLVGEKNIGEDTFAKIEREVSAKIEESAANVREELAERERQLDEATNRKEELLKSTEELEARYRLELTPKADYQKEKNRLAEMIKGVQQDLTRTQERSKQLENVLEMGRKYYELARLTGGETKLETEITLMEKRKKSREQAIEELYESLTKPSPVPAPTLEEAMPTQPVHQAQQAPAPQPVPAPVPTQRPKEAVAPKQAQKKPEPVKTEVKDTGLKPEIFGSETVELVASGTFVKNIKVSSGRKIVANLETEKKKLFGRSVHMFLLEKDTYNQLLKEDRFTFEDVSKEAVATVKGKNLQHVADTSAEYSLVLINLSGSAQKVSLTYEAQPSS